MKSDSMTKQERSVNRRVGTFSVPTHASLSSDKISDYPEWQEITLGDLTKESAFGPRFSSDLYSENGNVGTIRTTDLNDEGIINYQTIPYANLCEDSFKNHYLNNGDLLITRSGTCGVPCIFQHQEKPIVAGAFLIRFILKDTVDPTYLHLLLKSSDSQAKIQKMASGGVQKNLTGTNLKKLKINLPPLHEQKKIARILSSWDKAIETVEKLIENSKAQKKALMQQLLTGKRRLSGFDKLWKKGYLGDICLFKGGSAFKEIYQGEPEGKLPFIKVSDMNLPGNSIYIKYANNWISESVAKEIKAKPFPAGSVVFAKVGAALLLNRRRILERETIIDNNMMVAIPNNDCDTSYLYQLMLTIDFAKLVQDGAVPSINQASLSRFKIGFPKLKEQQKIAALLTTADKETTTLQKKLNCFKREKSALMQQLLTGKRRVKVDTDG